MKNQKPMIWYKAAILLIIPLFAISAFGEYFANPAALQGDQYTTSSLFSTPLNNAQFISQSVPTSMVAGQRYPVSVTMKNTGTSTWTAANNYRLGSQNPQDNLRWGTGRVYLSPSDSIKPGANKTFYFTITAPSTPGTYNFQWKMLRENVQWFGAYTTNTKITVSKPFVCGTGNDAGVPATPARGRSGLCFSPSDCAPGSSCVGNICCPSGYSCGFNNGGGYKCLIAGHATTFGNRHQVCMSNGSWKYAGGEACSTGSWCCSGTCAGFRCA